MVDARRDAVRYRLPARRRDARHSCHRCPVLAPGARAALPHTPASRLVITRQTVVLSRHVVAVARRSGSRAR